MLSTASARINTGLSPFGILTKDLSVPAALHLCKFCYVRELLEYWEERNGGRESKDMSSFAETAAIICLVWSCTVILVESLGISAM